MFAWVDSGLGTTEVDDGDYFGVYPVVVVNEGQSVKGIDIPFQPLVGTNATGGSIDPAIVRALHLARALD